jgi:hypothetical protein
VDRWAGAEGEARGRHGERGSWEGAELRQKLRGRERRGAWLWHGGRLMLNSLNPAMKKCSRGNGAIYAVLTNASCLPRSVFVFWF